MHKNHAKSAKWQDVIETPREGHEIPEIRCRYCSKTWYRLSVSRIDEHMLQCKKLSVTLYERVIADVGDWKDVDV